MFLTGAVEHVLRHGVATLSLRPLAAALGTSDRMLLYYFGSREQLLVAVLGAVGQQLRAGLEADLAPRPVRPAELLRQTWEGLRSPAAEAHLRLYVEVSGLAARGMEPYRTVAGDVASGWLTWIAAHLDVTETERPAAAAGILTVLDGLLLVRFLTSDDTADRAAAWLADRVDPEGS